MTFRMDPRAKLYLLLLANLMLLFHVGTGALTGFDSNLSAHPIDQALTDG